MTTEETLNSLIREVQEFGELEEDWDCEGGKPANKDTIEDVISIIKQTVEYIQFASVDNTTFGSIIIDWINDDYIISAEVATGHRIAFYCSNRHKDGLIDSQEITSDFKAGVERLIKNLPHLEEIPKDLEPIIQQINEDALIVKPSADFGHYTITKNFTYMEKMDKSLVPDLIAPNDYFLCVVDKDNYTVVKGQPFIWENKFYSELNACVLKNGEFHRFTMQEKLDFNRFPSNHTLITWDWIELKKMAHNMEPLSFIKLTIS